MVDTAIGSLRLYTENYNCMSFISTFIAVALLVPFFGWGIYILRLQLIFREELESFAKWTTVVGVFVFFILEMKLLRVSLGGDSSYYIITTLALLLSTTALYGHLLVSIASQMAVDMIHPPQEHDVDAPEFSQAEALEEVGDYKGALNEYLVMARSFPCDPEPIVKIADTYEALGEVENVVLYLEKALAVIGTPDHAVRVTHRLSSIYNREMAQPEEAIRVLVDFVERYPTSENTDKVQAKIDRLSEKEPEPEEFKSVTGMLEAPPVDLSE
jgi:hypothetical protein